MSSWLAKGSSDSAFDSHCLNFELYALVVEEQTVRRRRVLAQ